MLSFSPFSTPDHLGRYFNNGLWTALDHSGGSLLHPPPLYGNHLATEGREGFYPPPPPLFGHWSPLADTNICIDIVFAFLPNLHPLIPPGGGVVDFTPSPNGRPLVTGIFLAPILGPRNCICLPNFKKSRLSELFKVVGKKKSFFLLYIQFMFSFI